eukprot:2128205-Pleurochrysis_carterae.AAC.3
MPFFLSLCTLRRKRAKTAWKRDFSRGGMRAKERKFERAKATGEWASSRARAPRTQVLPFCLRRTKEAVLAELPPKIISDRTCDLHPLQRKLYAAFTKSGGKQSVADAISSVIKAEVDAGSMDALSAGTDAPTTTTTTPATITTAAATTTSTAASAATGGAKHVFTALQYLRRVCNHPLLALKPGHPLRAECEAAAAAANTTLHDIQFSPKLRSLQELLHECGIGISADVEGASSADGAASGSDDGLEGTALASHRALVFCQSADMLDLIEADLLRRHMPNVEYLRLDGKVRREPCLQKHTSAISLARTRAPTHALLTLTITQEPTHLPGRSRRRALALAFARTLTRTHPWPSVPFFKFVRVRLGVAL